MKSTNFPLTLKSIGVAALIAAVFGGGYLYRGHTPIASAQANTSVATAPVPLSAGKFLSLPDFSGIVAQQGSAVVNISASGTVKTGLAASPNYPSLTRTTVLRVLPDGCSRRNRKSRNRNIPCRRWGPALSSNRMAWS